MHIALRDVRAWQLVGDDVLTFVRPQLEQAIELGCPEGLSRGVLDVPGVDRSSRKTRIDFPEAEEVHLAQGIERLACLFDLFAT